MTKSLKWYRPIDPYIFILPTLVGLVIFRLIPILAAFVLSFTRWQLPRAPYFIGLDNYKELLSSNNLLAMSLSTLIFSVIYVLGILIFGISLAVLLNRAVRGIAIFRAMYYVPVVSSAVAVGVVWSWVLSPKYGILDILLTKLGFTEIPYWLSDPKLSIIVIALIQVWKMAGYYMLIFLGGLQSIPSSLVEVAKIDGGTKAQVFFKIILPLLSPTTFFVIIIGLIDSFKNFELIYTMTRGTYNTTTLIYGVYLNAFPFRRLGYGSSIAFFLLIIILIFSILNFRFKERWVKYQD